MLKDCVRNWRGSHTPVISFVVIYNDHDKFSEALYGIVLCLGSVVALNLFCNDCATEVGFKRVRQNSGKKNNAGNTGVDGSVRTGANNVKCQMYLAD